MKRKELIHSKLTNSYVLLVSPHTHGKTLKTMYAKRPTTAQPTPADELPLMTDLITGQLLINFNAPIPARIVRPTTVRRPMKITEATLAIQF